MSNGTNQIVIITGNLGQDPELKYMPNGDAVCNISVATNESWKNKDSGETETRAEWHRIVLFRNMAENTEKYTKKGSKVQIMGKLRTRKWFDESSNTNRWITEIFANSIDFLDRKPANSTPPETETENKNTNDLIPEPPEPENYFNDDIPF